MPLRLNALVAALAACACSAPPASAALNLTEVGTFTSPVYVTAPPGDPHRVFVVEQAGKIIEVLDGQKLATPFLDISGDVRSGGEQGLLSMAFAPDYATSGRFYVYYTAPRAGDSSGSVITVDEVSAAGRRNVFTVDHENAGNHNGGQLQFGPDGLLYAATGDGGSTPAKAQDLSSQLGKVLRVDPLSGAGPETYAYGLRNPFRFSFDRQTGDLIIGDVGQSAREEVDFSAPGTAPGVNYGWPCREGSIAGPGGCTATGNVVDPVLEKTHSGDGYCAIIGGYVVRDPALGALAGHYVYGDHCSTHVRAVTLPGAGDDVDTGLDVPGLSSFGEDSCGHLYAASLSGPVYRIDGDAFTPCPEPAPGPGPGPAPGPAPGPGGPPPPGGGATDDTRAPAVRLGSLRRQRALRLHGFRMSVRCDELCGVTVTATVRIKGSKRTYLLARMTRPLAANKRVKRTLRASIRTLRAIRSALRNHHRVTATFVAVGRDAAGNAGTAKRSVQARR
jgi:glucose/arabinose dehydrogenase